MAVVDNSVHNDFLDENPEAFDLPTSSRVAEAPMTTQGGQANDPKFTGSQFTDSLFDAEAEVTVTGWFNDPKGHHKQRYYNGAGWTEHVTHSGPSPCNGCNN